MPEDINLYHEHLAQQYLDHVRSCSTKIEVINEEIAQLRSQLTLSGVNYSEHVNGGSVRKDAIPDGVARMFELIDEYTTQQIEYLDEQKELHGVLMKLDPVEARLIKARWLDGKTWEQIAYMLNYSERNVLRVHKFALLNVYENMPTQYKESVPAI